MRVLMAFLAAIFVAGCEAGIMSRQDLPSTPTLSGGSSGSGIAGSASKKLYLRTSPSSFGGGVQGSSVKVSDPFFELGKAQVLGD